MSKQEGKIGLILIIAIVIITAVLLSGGNPFGKYKPSGTSISNEPTEATISGQCCNSGDRDRCQPELTDTDKQFTFNKNGKKYGLLKSDITLTEGPYHLKEYTGQTVFPPNNYKIIENTTDGYSLIDRNHNCGNGINDQVYGPGANIMDRCSPIPNDSLVYVCKENCTTETNSYCGNPQYPGLVCFGNPTSKYDVYFDIDEYNSRGIPTVIKECPASLPGSTNQSQASLIIVPPVAAPAEDSLQLKNLKFIQVPPNPGSTSWISPWCKPAIYLYPEKTSQIHVNVSPVGKMNYTDPQYPNGGWQVQASPNGNITYQDKSYPYLYYEAEIPNQNIQKPTEGYVVTYTSLSGELDQLLPKLGLNKKEWVAFKEYWIKVLPKSAYYFIGIMPESNLDSIAPLDISPKPDKIIRVTLYFQALDQKITVSEPRITTPIRTGFTVVEWGGIFQKDLNHPFSCFM